MLDHHDIPFTKTFGGSLKAITHARKEMMLAYFEVVETELRRALEEAAAAGTPTMEPSFVEFVAARVRDRMSDIAARMPEASAPSFQQIRKNLENVLAPTVAGDPQSDPIKAVHALKQQLHSQPKYTPPKGGMWNRARQAHQRKGR